MAQAVKSMWPDVKVAIGPAIDNGFYYDFDKAEPFTPDDLKRIEKEMWRIINKNPRFVQRMMPRGEARAFFEKHGETYKVELIDGIEDQEVSIYTTGDGAFVDLCRGPHIAEAREIKAFKLVSVAGAYWRGDETRPMLQRIYAVCFETPGELDGYLAMMAEAEKRDHRKLGPQLDLFQIYHDQAGAGLVFYHPQGALLRKIIEDYLRNKHLASGYDLVQTPNLLKGKLWEQSGHAGYYRENMYYLSVDEEEYAVKPMNCPGHMLIYKSRLHSYRELPIRYFELGTVYRQEKAGVLHGLLRVRGFTQDDAHIFCTPAQLRGEVEGVIDFVSDTMNDFGFHDLDIEISTRPEKFIGRVEDWETATEALKASLIAKGIAFKINEGDGAFYGPKIDIKLKDAIGRAWQCATIQCDFSLPERFDLSYIDEDGTAHRPIMIHRAVLGSVERFIGTLIEHYAGNFPLWLSPTQALVIPIKTEHEAYAGQVLKTLQARGLRVIMDSRNESLNRRVREAAMKKTPYVLIIGDQEAHDAQVSVRKRGNEDLGKMSCDAFAQMLDDDIRHRR